MNYLSDRREVGAARLFKLQKIPYVELCSECGDLLGPDKNLKVSNYCQTHKWKLTYSGQILTSLGTSHFGSLGTPFSFESAFYLDFGAYSRISTSLKH